MARGFPMDVMYTILTLLPVESLLRFRSVCKTWCDLIDSPGFIKSHLDRSLESNSNQSLIFVDWHNRSVHQMHDFDSLPWSSKITFPETKIDTVVGACNGLICARRNNFVFLWNPSTRKSRHIQAPENIAWKCYGFGYDCLRDDYKLVVWSCGEVAVYSLRDDSWKTLAQTNKIIGSWSKNWRRGVLANNCLHWIQGGPGDEQVMVFDLHHEEWSKLPLPTTKAELILELGLFDGCLCLDTATNHPTMSGSTNCYRWSMKEYGVKESWTKLFNDPGGMPLIYCNRRSKVIFARSFVVTGSIFIGRLGQGKTKKVESSDTIHYDISEFLTTYVESLTPVTYSHGLPRPVEEFSMKDLTSGKKRKLLEQPKEPSIRRTHV